MIVKNVINSFCNIKKKIGIVTFFLVTLCCIGMPFLRSSAEETTLSQEKISSFTSDVTVRSDGMVDVVETIQYDFGNNSKYGIFRTIPLNFKPKGQPDHITIKVTSVTDENKVPYIFEITSKNPLEIKIGNPNKSLTGLHTYVLSYTVESSIGFFDTYDEIYWNITGDTWEVPIEFVGSTVTISGNSTPEELHVAHYCGLQNEQKQCGDSIVDQNGTVTFTTKSDTIINPTEQVTIAVGFPKGLVPSPSLRDFLISFIENYWSVLVVLGIAMVWFRKRILFWYQRRNFYKKNPIVVEYDPGIFNPLESAIILNARGEPKDITTLIISLAIQGLLKIENKDDEFLFTKVASSTSENKDYENKLLDSLNNKRESDLGTSFYTSTMEIITSTTTSLVARDYLSKNSLRNISTSKFLPIFICLFLAVNPGVFFFILLGKIPGFIFSGTCVVIGIIYLVIAPKPPYLLSKGLDAERKLLGLKLYIKMAEKERINFANAPAKTPELFEKLLPYAVMFGFEKKWAKEFEAIYTIAPSWYVSHNPNFSSSFFVTSIHSMGSTITQTMKSSTSSGFTSRSGSSGSRGGGSSGGGGGGGGGRSW